MGWIADLPMDTDRVAKEIRRALERAKTEPLPGVSPVPDLAVALAWFDGTGDRGKVGYVRRRLGSMGNIELVPLVADFRCDLCGARHVQAPSDLPRCHTECGGELRRVSNPYPDPLDHFGGPDSRAPELRIIKGGG